MCLNIFKRKFWIRCVCSVYSWFLYCIHCNYLKCKWVNWALWRGQMMIPSLWRVFFIINCVLVIYLSDSSIPWMSDQKFYFERDVFLHPNRVNSKYTLCSLRVLFLQITEPLKLVGMNLYAKLTNGSNGSPVHVCDVKKFSKKVLRSLSEFYIFPSISLVHLKGFWQTKAKGLSIR